VAGRHEDLGGRGASLNQSTIRWRVNRYGWRGRVCGPQRGVAVCNLYSMTKSQAAIREWIRAMRDTTGNLPPMPCIFPDMMAPRRAHRQRRRARADRASLSRSNR